MGGLLHCHGVSRTASPGPDNKLGHVIIIIVTSLSSASEERKILK